MSKRNLQRAATDYLAAGLCVLPARRAEKRPAVGRWKQYRKRLPTEAELSAWFTNDPDAICIVCGHVSGNGEMIDFDAGGELFDAWAALIPPDLLSKLVIETTQRDGRHVYYRCEAKVCGNMKLAQRSDGEKIVTLIETRGEGGLFLCAPTAGYEVIQGDLCDPPMITVAERDLLLQTAWELNEYLPPVVDGPKMSAGVGHGGPLPANNSNIRPISADSSENRHGATDSSNNDRFSTDNPHEGRISAKNSHRCDCLLENSNRPGDDFNHRGDVRAVLEQFGWVRTKGGENEYWRRPGKTSGTSATLKDRVFYVFSSNAAPFEPNRAYSPFAVYTLLNHGGDYEQAARCLRERGFGGDSLADNAAGANISAIMRMSTAPGTCSPDNSHNGNLSAENSHKCDCPPDNGDCGQSLTDDSDSRPTVPDIADPGPIPEHLFRVPGFVAMVCDFTLAHAPYPNLGLAFCGAMALQSYLCARKVRTPGDLRPNIYLLALASSGTGKDFPRKVNSRVLFEIGRVAALGDKFASGEGIQDALVRSNAMLFQNDEMDGVLRQINLDRENKRESIPNILLTLYTSASDIYPIRVKAGQKDAAHIDQPHLTLFGTATPKFFYESLSQRMLTNGLFARMMIVDIGKRGRGQVPGSARDLPDGILQTARWWDEFCPGQRKKGNLYEVHPEPRVVPFTPEAEQAVERLQRMGEDEYEQADAANDEIGKAAWSRTCENAKKLALLYACSENHEDPVIGLPAVEWATAFAMHQTRRQLYLAATYVAENPFHAECLKLLRKLKDAGGQMARRQVMRAMRCKAADFDQIISTLMQQGDIVAVDIPTRTRPAQGYQLT